MRKLTNILVAVLLFFCLDFVVASILRHGTDHYFGFDECADILLVGHSHLMLAVDKQRMEDELGVKVAKYCREGVGVEERYYMIKQYLDSPCGDSLRTLMYGVDLCTFTEGGLSDNSYKLFYPFIDNADIADMIRSKTDAVSFWSHKILHSYRYNDFSVMNASIRGLRNDWSNKKDAQIDMNAYAMFVASGGERSIDMSETLINRFQESIALATERGIRVILINTPTLDVLNSLEPEKFDAVCAWFRDFADKNEMVEYWDFNPEYSCRHELFFDRLHVNSRGQQVITDKIIAQYE